MSYMPPQGQQQAYVQPQGPTVVVVNNQQPYGRYDRYGIRYGYGYGGGMPGWGLSSCNGCYPMRRVLLVIGIIAAVLSVIFLCLTIYAASNLMNGTDTKMSDDDWFDKTTSHSSKWVGRAAGFGFGLSVSAIVAYVCLPIAIYLLKRGQPATTTTGTTQASNTAVAYNPVPPAATNYPSQQPYPYGGPTGVGPSAAPPANPYQNYQQGQVTGYQYQSSGSSYNKQAEAMVQPTAPTYIPPPSGPGSAPPPYPQ